MVTPKSDIRTKLSYVLGGTFGRAVKFRIGNYFSVCIVPQTAKNSQICDEMEKVRFFVNYNFLFTLLIPN